MNVQLIVIIVIGAIVAAIIAQKTYRFFTTKESGRGCPGCSSCEIPEKKIKTVK